MVSKFQQSNIKKSQLMMTFSADPTIWNNAYNLVSKKRQEFQMLHHGVCVILL